MVTVGLIVIAVSNDPKGVKRGQSLLGQWFGIVSSLWVSSMTKITVRKQEKEAKTEASPVGKVGHYYYYH